MSKPYKLFFISTCLVICLSQCCCPGSDEKEKEKVENNENELTNGQNNGNKHQQKDEQQGANGQHKANEIDDPEVIKKKKEVEGFYNDFDKKYKNVFNYFKKEDLIDEFIKKYKDDCNYNKFEEYVKNKLREDLINDFKHFDFFDDNVIDDVVNKVVESYFSNNAAEAEKHMSEMFTKVYEIFNVTYELENVINDQEKEDIIEKIKTSRRNKVEIENFIKDLLSKKAEEMYKKICVGLNSNKKVAEDFSFTDDEKKAIIDKIIESKFDEKEVLEYIYDEIFKTKAETIYDEIYKDLEKQYNLEKDFFFRDERREGIIQYIINSCFNKGEIENYIKCEIKKEKAEKLYDKNKEDYGCLNNLLEEEHDRILSKFIELNFNEGKIKKFLDTYKHNNEEAEKIYNGLYKEFEKKYGNRLKCLITNKEKKNILSGFLDSNFKEDVVKGQIRERIEKFLEKNEEERKDREDTISTILNYGSCIVCKDTSYNSSCIENNYDFDKKEYIYCYDKSHTRCGKNNAAAITNNGVFNFRQAHICMSMLAKSSEEDDDKKISGTLYRSGVLGYILKHESGNPTYLIPDGFINNRRGDLCSNAISFFGYNGFPIYIFEYVKAEENYDNFIKKIDEKKKELKEDENCIFLYDDENFLDNLYKNGYITDEMKTSERMHLELNTLVKFSLGKTYKVFFTNLSFLCAKDDEVCYRLKDNFEDGGDDFPFDELKLKDTFKTKINFTKGKEGNLHGGYYDNLFFYKPSKNFFKNVCKTKCLNYTTKVYDFKEKKVGNRYFVSENNEIPIVPISKIKNPGFNYNKKLNIAAYKIECIGIFMDIRTLKGNDCRRIEHYKSALKVLDRKKQKYVIVLTDDCFVIDTVEHLSEFFEYIDKENIYIDIGKIYNEKWINPDIDFNAEKIYNNFDDLYFGLISGKEWKEDKVVKVDKVKVDKNTIIEKFKELKLDKVQIEEYIEKEVIKDLIENNDVVDYIYDIYDEKYNNFYHIIDDEEKKNKIKEDFKKKCKCNKDEIEKYINDLLVSEVEKIYKYFDDLYFGLISGKAEAYKDTTIEKFKEKKFDKAQIESHIEWRIDEVGDNDVAGIYDIYDKKYYNFHQIGDDENIKNEIKEDFKKKCKCNKDKIEKYIKDLLVNEAEKIYNKIINQYGIGNDFFNEDEKNDIIEKIKTPISNIEAEKYIASKIYENLSRKCKLDECFIKKEGIVKKIIELKFNIEDIEEYIESEITKFKGQYEKINEKYYLDGLSNCLSDLGKGEKENFIKEIKSLFDVEKSDEEIENAIKEKIKSNKNIKIFAEKINSKINESYCGIFLNKENKLDSALTEKIENFGCVYSSVVDYAKGIIDSYNEEETDIAVKKAYNFINKRFCGIFNEGKKEENEKKDIVDFNNKIGEGTIKKKIKELKFDREEIEEYIKKELSSIDLEKNLIIADEISDRIYSYFDDDYGLNACLDVDGTDKLKEKVIGFVKEYIKNKTSDFYDEIKDYIEDHVI